MNDILWFINIFIKLNAIKGVKIATNRTFWPFLIPSNVILTEIRKTNPKTQKHFFCKPIEDKVQIWFYCLKCYNNHIKSIKINIILIIEGEIPLVITVLKKHYLVRYGMRKSTLNTFCQHLLWIIDSQIWKKGIQYVKYTQQKHRSKVSKHNAPTANYKSIIHQRNIHDDQLRAPSKIHAQVLL